MKISYHNNLFRITTLSSGDGKESGKKKRKKGGEREEVVGVKNRKKSNFSWRSKTRTGKREDRIKSI